MSKYKKMIDLGIKVADSRMFQEDKIWSKYSDDKIDIGERLARIIRTLLKDLSLSKDMRALSIGSGDEPQFRILENIFREGLYLLDLEKEALSVIKERINRQYINHVKTILGDYKRTFSNLKSTNSFLKTKLKGHKVTLIALHHSLYYCKEKIWDALFDNLYKRILAPKGAIHAVLMASKSDNRYSTTWLYNHFAGKFFGYKNDQDLLKFKQELQKDPTFKNAQIRTRTSQVRFFMDDFEKFMSVIWMILLYPNVHKYNLRQKEEIVEFVYNNFWKKKHPLLQIQHHMAIYRGLNIKGLI